MKKRDRILAALAIVGVISICLLQASSQRTVTIKMDDSGFQPYRIKIQPGQRVIWTNEGQKERWPASNSHPDHKDYFGDKAQCPGINLDSCKSLKKGESYSFTFDKQGSWGMHDHLNPGAIMIVEVVNVNKGWTGKLQMLVNGLFSKDSVVNLPTPVEFRSLSFDRQYTILDPYARDDPRSAWEYLKSAFIVNGQTVHNPHELAHMVGAYAYENSGMTGVSVCDQSFAYGCFHGVAEAGINDKGEIAVVEIEKACTRTLSSEQAPSCYHGIGHGTAGIHNLNVGPALGACEAMESTHREYCYDGVFMEHATSLGSQSVNQLNPWELCGSLELKFHMACARYQPTRLQAAGLDFAKIINSCAPAPTSVLEEYCFRSSGFSAVSSGGHDLDSILNQCSNANLQRGKELCLSSAATEITFQAYNNWQSVAPQLCEVVTDPVIKDGCKQGYLDVVAREGR